jgi:hypothetical protein
MVMMGEHDPQADDVAPENGRMPYTEIVAEGVRRLADDLQEALPPRAA